MDKKEILNNLEMTIVRVNKDYNIGNDEIEFEVKMILKNNTEYLIPYATFNFKYYDKNNNLIDVDTKNINRIEPNCENIEKLTFCVTDEDYLSDTKNKWEISISHIATPIKSEEAKDISNILLTNKNQAKDTFKINLLDLLKK